MTILYEKDNQDIVCLTMNMAGHAANVINNQFETDLRHVLEKLQSEKLLNGVILTSAKKSFMVGRDLDWIVHLEDAAAAFNSAESLKDSFRQLEMLGKPVVAAINGTALGGGLEIALACHRRIVIDDPRHKLGLPEVTLGLLPGGGGIIRLTRIMGLQKAFPYLLEGKQITPQAAIEAGIIDELAADEADLMSRARAWILANPAAIQPWDMPRYRMPGGSSADPRVAQMLAIAPAMLKKKTYGNFPAPEAIMNAAVEGANVDFATASRIESRYFTQVATSKVAKNMITAFWFQLNEIKAGASRPAQIPAAATKRVGVLGAGMMGHGIAYVAATAGMDVILKDISFSKAAAGKASAAAILDERVRHGRLSESQQQRTLNHILPTSDPAHLQGCDLVIEAVFEDRPLKEQVLSETEAQLDESAVLASNTSTLPITSLAQVVSRPANFIGLHFISPVHKMKLVEIIRGPQTSDEALAKAFDFVQRIGKLPILVNDSRGFYTSRVFSTYLKEGLSLLQEGQLPRAIESAGLKAGMPVGPLALADEVSFSLMCQINDQTRRDLTAEGKTTEHHPADEILTLMTATHNRLGKAHGAGFYDYPADGIKHLWPELTKLFPAKNGRLSQHEMIERLLFIQALETARCSEEGVLHSVADANIGSIFGWGFAPFKGGTLQYINDYGPAPFVARCHQLSVQYGTRFQPPALLEEMAQSGETF